MPLMPSFSRFRLGELAVLNRLLMFSLNDVGEGELHDHAHGVQMWTIMQLLTGKLLETWNMLVERFLKSNPEDPSEAHKKDLAWLKDYCRSTAFSASSLVFDLNRVGQDGQDEE